MVTAQSLTTFSETMQANGKCYLDIKNKKACSVAEGRSAKESINMALIQTTSGNQQLFEWYNMSGKDEKISPELRGTNTLIRAISFDKDQFDKCRTVADLKRMTGHVTVGSFSHFATITNTSDVDYRCFLLQLDTGKRVLVFITDRTGHSFKIIIKSEP